MKNGKIGEFLRRVSAGYRQFMYGRYGNDKLNLFISAVALALCLVSFAAHSFWLTTGILVMLAATFFRSMSRNFERRRRENQAFERLAWPFAQFFRYAYARVRYRGTHRVFMCGGCRNVLKIPVANPKAKAAGAPKAAPAPKTGRRVEIKCPKCGRSFVKSI